MANAAFKKMKTPLTRKLDLTCKEKTSKMLHLKHNFKMELKLRRLEK
jgi:hypothetical protein